MEILILTLLRLLVPLTILRWPIMGMLASMYLDLQDFNYFTIRTGQDMANYQSWDKIFDTYYLAIAFYVSFSWKDKIAKKLSIFSFLYRAIGVLIFLLVQSRTLLLFFPNLSENLFLFYLIFRHFTKKEQLYTNMKVTIIVVASVVIPKIIAEFYLHVLKSPPIPGLDRTVITPAFPTSQEGLILYSLYIGPAILALIWLILKTRSGKLRQSSAIRI